MESNEIREQLREAERAAAAPHVLQPKYRWWQIALLSMAGPLVALTVGLAFTDSNAAGTWPTLANLAMLIILVFFILDQRKRHGTTPKGRAPLELRPVYRWFYIGAAAVLACIIVLAWVTPLWLSLPVSLALCAVGLTWFRAAYGRAADRVRERLA